LEKCKHEKGKEYVYNPDIIPLDDQMHSISLEDGIANTFSKAMRIQFWPSSRPNEPEMVIFVFDKKQAITAYNNLFDIANNKTTFLKLEENGHIKVSFIDAVEDFHITVPNLAYYKENLNAFKSSIGENHSFGFVLGLDHPERDRPILLPTTSDFKLLPWLVTFKCSEEDQVNRTEEEVHELIITHQPDIDGLKKMFLNIHSVASIRFWYWRLSNFMKSHQIHDDLMSMEGLNVLISA
jgi:hypothetical protein